jgi:sec-independent protein translocase protein TatB
MRHATLRIVFGLSFGELCVLLLVAVVVFGPKELPRYLRKGGQLAGKLRRMAFEMREKSGIDEVLRTEGIDRDIAEIRSLARGEIGGVMSAVRSTADAVRLGGAGGTAANGLARPNVPGTATVPATTVPAQATPGQAPQLAPELLATVPAVPSSQTGAMLGEYPREGVDSYGALPDDAAVYGGAFPASALADDPLYARGEDDAAAPSASPSATAATGTAG